MQTAKKKIKVGTTNFAGFAQEESAHSNKLRLLAKSLRQPDVVALQELVRVRDPAGRTVYDCLEELDNEWHGGYEIFPHYHLSSASDPHPRKWLRKEGRIKEWVNDGCCVEQGAAIMVKTPGKFCHLWLKDEPGTGTALTLPCHQGDEASPFLGGRDTEPRALLVAALEISGTTLIFCTTQLTTLSEENQGKVRTPTPAAIAVRRRQLRWILSYLDGYRLERERLWRLNSANKGLYYANEPIVIAGDFNCKLDAPELRELRTIGLETVAPTGSIDYSHRTHRQLVDHIFATNNLVQRTSIIDLTPLEIELDRRVSDHNPVIAWLVLPST